MSDALDTITLLIIAVTIYWISKTVKLTLDEKIERIKAVSKFGEQERDQLFDALYADRENFFLFLDASVNGMSHRLHPETNDVWPRLNVVGVSEDCWIYYLMPEPLPLDAYVLASGVVDKYQPWADIHRYAVYCRRGCRKVEGCGVLKKLGKACAEAEHDLVRVDPNALVAYHDDDGRYGNAGITYVGDGDGRCGPVSAKLKLREWKMAKALEETCKSCPFHKCENGKRERSAAVDVCPDVRHGGIISFFGRVLGRK